MQTSSTNRTSSRQVKARSVKLSFVGKRDHKRPSRSRFCSRSIYRLATNWQADIYQETYFRRKHRRSCRSEALLGNSDNLVFRRRTKSASLMDSRNFDECLTSSRDFSSPGDSTNDGAIDSQVNTSALREVFSNESEFSGTSTCLDRAKRLVEQPQYRELNLEMNNIHLLHSCQGIPEHVGNLVELVGRDRDSLGPSSDEIRDDVNLHDLWINRSEPDVEKHFRVKIFPELNSLDSLKCSDRSPMARFAVPPCVGKNVARVSYPVPDRLYGYNRTQAFSVAQRGQLGAMGNQIVGNRHGLLYSFFLVEFQGDGPGNFWVTTNQCLRGAATCLNMTEHLNTLTPF